MRPSGWIGKVASCCGRLWTEEGWKVGPLEGAHFNFPTFQHSLTVDTSDKTSWSVNRFYESPRASSRTARTFLRLVHTRVTRTGSDPARLSPCDSRGVSSRTTREPAGARRRLPRGA